jgi:hypothetical protein
MLGFSCIAAAAALVNDRFTAGEVPSREAFEALLAALDSAKESDG